jgi:hypothetical protein
MEKLCLSVRKFYFRNSSTNLNKHDIEIYTKSYRANLILYIHRYTEHKHNMILVYSP